MGRLQDQGTWNVANPNALYEPMIPTAREEKRESIPSLIIARGIRSSKVIDNIQE